MFSVLFVWHFPIFIEEFKAGVAVHFHEIVAQLVASGEEVVEVVVAEADESVVLDGAAVVYAPNVGP